MEDKYLKCSKCGHENYVDPDCEIPPEHYDCDQCGARLRGWVITKEDKLKVTELDACEECQSLRAENDQLKEEKEQWEPQWRTQAEANAAGYNEALERIQKLRDENKQLRVQLAGCSSAALGYGGDCKPGDYGYSVSFQDVMNLRDRMRRMEEAIRLLETQRYGFVNRWAGVWKECKNHGVYATGGNWGRAEGAGCPCCFALAALGATREGGK